MSKHPPTVSIRDMKGTVKVTETHTVISNYGESIVCKTDTGVEFWGNTSIRKHLKSSPQLPITVTFGEPKTFKPKTGEDKEIEYIPITIA